MMRRQLSDENNQYDDDSSKQNFSSAASTTINNGGSSGLRPWSDPDAANSVQMSIWKELCGSSVGDERQDWRRTAPYALAEDEDSGWATRNEEHEERRILERFGSAFPKGNKGRKAAVMLLDGISGGSLDEGSNCGGSGGSTPKSGRRRNKRKGCDSPRPAPEEINKADPPDPMEEPVVDTPSPVDDQGHRHLSLDDLMMRFRESGNNEGEEGGHYHGGNEPVISHGMRPARGWASLDLLSDYEDEAVTVSPRVLSPIEMDEPAGSFHGLRFAHGRSVESVKEPQERRTCFLALGNLNGDRRIGRPSLIQVAADEHPAAARAKQLVHQIHGLKEKVKLYEDAFEQRYGYRPSHHQKMDDRTTKRFLTELARARKEVKQLKDRYHLPGSSNEPVDILMEQLELPTTSSFRNNIQDQPCLASVEQTVIQVQEHLAGNRELAGRSEIVDELTAKEILDEKLAVQRALLYVESLHGRPTSYGHKDLLRPLYDRYRILKRMVVRSGLSRSKEEICDLAPILEYETLELSDTWSAGGPGGPGSGLHRHSAPSTPTIESMEETPSGDPRPAVPQRHLTTPITGTDLRMESCFLTKAVTAGSSSGGEKQCCKRQRFSLNIEENLHALPLNQLVEQLRHVREEKRRLRRTIRDLEASDLLRQGSASGCDPNMAGSSTSSSRCCSLETVYGQYRHARAKLRLLEALVAKHDGSATL